MATRIAIAALLWAICAHASAASQAQIAHAVQRVWQAKGVNNQVGRAETLRNLALQTDPSLIGDRTIHSIASLLNIHNDAIRYWIAEALGHFGPRAQFAAPKLLAILHAEECVIAETSSEGMIRQTLARIGRPAPEHKCVHAILPR